MEVKAFAATLGLGMLAGAAVTLMLPKDCKAKQVAQDAADTIKQEVTQAVQSMTE